MSTKDIVLIALFAAIVATLGVFPPITIPVVSVPITAQSLGVMLAGGILGAKRGALALLLFIVLVAIGLPLLSGGRGGLGVFIGPSGGLLVGWIVAAYATGWMVERCWAKLNYISAFLACTIGGDYSALCNWYPLGSLRRKNIYHSSVYSFDAFYSRRPD